MKILKRMCVVGAVLAAMVALSAAPASANQAPPGGGGSGGSGTGYGSGTQCVPEVTIRFDSGYTYVYATMLNCDAYDVQFLIHLQRDGGPQTNVHAECAAKGASCNEAWHSGARLANPSGVQEWEASVDTITSGFGTNEAGAYTWG
jgi:hypothetical protein